MACVASEYRGHKYEVWGKAENYAPMMSLTSHVYGATAAVAAAFFWALAAFLFKRVSAHVPPLSMNFVKGGVALMCLALVLGAEILHMPKQATFIALALSGVVGIGLGDTLYFHALCRLGPRRTLIITTLVPVMAALGGWLWFGDALTWFYVIAMILVLGGVTVVLWEKTTADTTNLHLMGIVLGLIYITAEACGILLTKFAVTEWSSLHASWIRQLCASIAIGVVLAARKEAWVPKLPLKLWQPLLVASVFGAFLGTWLSVEALKLTHTAVATTLSSISPLFAIPLAIVLERERISLRSVLATLVAILGVAILFAYGQPH